MTRFKPGDVVTNGTYEFEVVFYYPSGVLVAWLHKSNKWRKGSSRKATFNPEVQKTLRLVTTKD